MEDNNRMNLIIKAATDLECSSCILGFELSENKYQKFPLTEVSTLGSTFDPLVSVIQKITGTGPAGGKSGIYRVTIPAGPGIHLARFKDKPGYLGTVVKDKKGVTGQAVLESVPLDPTMVFMAMALKGIDDKLDTILEIQKDIMNFLEQKEKSKLRGNLNVLTDVLNNYKYNWNNEKYKTNKHIQVQEIKRESEQSIIFNRVQIESSINKKSFMHRDRDVKNKLQKVQSQFEEYQLALYLFSFSSFLEVMLLENFQSAYLNSATHKIEDYSFHYRELYTKSYDQIEDYSKSSVRSNVLSGLATVNKFVGEAAGKVPVLSKSKFDETLIDASTWLDTSSSKKTEQTMSQFLYNRINDVSPFVDNINNINRLYNQPMELLFDQENMYIALSE
ncbi:MAG: hypothetical protein GX046_02765 [Tissierellia bacterium]|nr:hypothetical protein [Tissierellia bacterium]